MKNKLTQAQVALALGIRPARQTPASKPAPTAKPPAPEPPKRAAAPSFNAMDASPEDIARRYQQLGLDTSGIENRMTPPKDPAAQRAAHRALDRIERDRMRAEEARATAINAGAIDARTATHEEVRARLGSFGVEAHVIPDNRVERPAEPTAEDRAVAASVRKAMTSGKHVDVTKLTAGERVALNETGNTGYQRGGNSGLGY